MSAKYSANIGLQSISLDAVSLAAPAGIGSEFALIIPNHGTPSIAWQIVFSAPVGSITVLLEASLDGTNWFAIDTSTSITGEIRVVSGSYRFLRINNSAVTVGAGITITASFVYSNTTFAGINTTSESFLHETGWILLSNAQVLALNTSPVEVVPAVANTVYVPRGIIWYHPAGGTAYTLAGVTALQVRKGTNAVNGPTFNGIGFLDSNTIELLEMLGPGNASALFSGTDVSADLNLNINLFAAGANPATGTFPIWVNVSYQKVVLPG